MNPAIQQAISAIKAGERQKAYRLLAQVIQDDPHGTGSELAWILMSSVVKDPRRKRQSLEAALAINPDSEVAKQRLATLEQTTNVDKPTGAIEPQSVPRPPEEKREETASAVVSYRSAEEGASTQPHSSNQTLPVRDLNFSINPLQVMGLVGAFLLMVGVFTPIISLPIVGDMNYFQNGQGDGVYVLILAAVSLVPIFLNRYQWLWITGLLALTLIAATLLQFVWVIAQLRQAVTEEASDNLFAGLAELLVDAVQIQWGWVLLITGALLILVAATLGGDRSWPHKHIAAGLVSSLVLLSILVATRVLGGNWLTVDGLLGQSSLDGAEAKYISAGESVQFKAGKLQVLQVHNPTAFHVTESSGLGHEGVEAISGVSYVSIEMEFTCSEVTEVVCDTVPEASLELELEDGRRVEDDWSLYDARWLGEEDVAGGESTIGWRVFRVPQSAQLKSLVIEPYSETVTYVAQLPEAVDGYTVSQSWQELDDGRIQLIPALRRRLQQQGIVAANVMRTEFNSDSSGSPVDGGLYLELCTDTSFHFDEDEAIAEHRTLILNTLTEAVDYHRGGELLLLNINDCSSFSVSEINVGFRDTDLSSWQRGSMSDTELLRRAIVTLD
jgi:hypothetical protein